MSIWPDQSGNKLNQTYLKGFLDVSGGDITIRNNGSISIGKNATMNGNLNVGNNAILNGNVTIGQNTVPYLFYDFETIDICNNINNVIQVIPVPQLIISNPNTIVNSWVVNNQKDALSFKNGSYDISASSFIGTNFPYYAFNGSYVIPNVIPNFWQSNVNYTNGNYTGNTVTSYTLNGISTTIGGEWLQINLPYSMILTKYSFICNTPAQGPKIFYIFGSNSNSSWSLITNVTVSPNTSGTSPYSNAIPSIPTTFYISNYNPQPFSYYRLVINKIWSPGNNISTSIQQWNLYGNPYSSSSVITTNLLYNYGLKTYDALFSSTPSNMIDFTKSITGSSSVLLDGSNNSIVLPYFPVTNTGLTFSCWIRPTFPTVGTKLYTIFEFMNASNIITLILNTENRFLYWNISNPIPNDLVRIQNFTITPSVWTHIAWTMTYDSGNNSTWQFFINGVNVFSNRLAYPLSGDFFINYIGRSSILNATYPNNTYQDFSGNIDQFRAYNTVLTSFQIGSLYNIEKTLIVNNSLYYHYNDVFLGNKLAVLGDTSFNSNVTITTNTISTSSTNGAFVVSGGVGIGGNTNIGGNIIVNSTLDSTTTSNGAFVVTGGAGIGGKVNIAGNTKINASTASVSTDTGALIVSGGVGISGNIYIGGSISSSGISSPQFNSPNNILTTGNTPAYYLLGRLSGKNFQIVIISGANNYVINTNAEICTITGIIFPDNTITASYYTSGQNLVLDNIYVNQVGTSYDIYIHTNVNYSMQCFFNVYNINGNWTVNPTLNTSIPSNTITTLTASWITLNNLFVITSNRVSTSSTTGALIIAGGIGVGGNINVASRTISTDLSSGAFILSGGAAISGNVNIGENAKVNANTPCLSSTSGAFVVTGGIGVGGNIFIGSTNPSISSTNGALIVSGGAGIGGNVNIGGNINVASQSISTDLSSGAFILSGGAAISGNVNIGENAKVNANTPCLSSTSGAFVVTGGIGVGGNIFIGSTAISTSSTTGALRVVGGAGIEGNVNIGSTNTSTSSTSGAFTVVGGAGIGGNLYVGSTQESTLNTNGSLVVSGGVGIAKNAIIGGDVKMGINSTSIDLSSGSLIVTGGAAITGNLNIGGNKTIIYSTASSTSTTTGALTISGGIGIGENANIKGNTTVTGTINATGLMTCSGGLVTPVFNVTTNTAITPDTKLHNSYILLSVNSSINQFLPPILSNLSSIINITNKSNVNHTISCSGSDSFDGSSVTGSSMTLPSGYSMRVISGGTKWFVDNYKKNDSRIVDTNTDQSIGGNKTFNGISSFNSISANGITDNGILTTLQTLNTVNDITAGGIITGNRIIDIGSVTTIKSLSSEGTVTATGITDNGNTNLGTSTSNILTVNSLTKINGGISNKVFNLNSIISPPTSTFYGATINFLATIPRNIDQHIPTAVISVGYNTTIFLVNYSNTQPQTIYSDGGNFYGQQTSNTAGSSQANIRIEPNYSLTLRSDGTNWSVQNTQHITNIPIDNAADQIIGGFKMFSSVLNINGGVFYRNIPVTANDTVGNASWYGSAIDISNSTTWTTTLPSAVINTNMYIWNHSAVPQTLNANNTFNTEIFVGYNVTNNSTSISIPAYSMIAIRSTSTYATKAWYVQPYVREGSFFMDNYSNQSFSGTKTFTGSTNFGTSKTDTLTVNSQIYAINGIVYPTLNYSAYTTEYDRFFGNFIMFVYFPSQPTGSQLLPSIPAETKSSTIKFFNNTTYTLTLTRQNSSQIYGLLGNSLTSVSLLPGYIYEITSMYSGGTFDNWIVTNVNSQYQSVDIGTDQTIGGNKTFSNAITTPGIIIPNPISNNPGYGFKKIVLYNGSNSMLSTNTSFYGFGIGASILSYNVDSPNSNHIFYCAEDGTGSAIGYTELLRIGNAGIFVNKDLTINAGNKMITPAITLNGADLGTTISTLTTNVAALPTKNGTNTWTGTNTFTQTVTALAFNVTSDYRIKDDIYSLHILPDEFTVDKLKPVCYYNNQTKKQDIGLVAHELQEEYPFLVNGEKDGENYQSVNYTGLIGILIKEIQELKTRIALLEQNGRDLCPESIDI